MITDADRATWRDNAYRLLGKLFTEHPDLSPRVLWEVGPGRLVGRVEAFLPGADAQQVAVAAAEMLGLDQLNPCALEPGLTRIAATAQIDDIDVTVLAVLRYDDTP
ncbi:hypothetical protein ACIBHY_17240 [Nonomuraea sp. NPDC050547]|uniref:hypothetical protein n=1 Tax=Nonomuraea sp. NPDC050547 TaxID=3364368 RepID=UPI00379ACF52